MAFDPDKYLEQKAQAPAAGFDPDAYLATKTASITPSEPGIGETLARGAANGLLFSGEPLVAGGVDALKKAVLNGEIGLDDITKNFKAGRDEANQNNKAAADAHSVANFVGNVAGSLPLALLTGGASEAATLGNAVKTGAQFGAANAVGSGLSQGKGVGDITKDALKDAAVGGVTGGILHGVVAGGKAALSKALDTDVVSAPVEGFKQGLAGRDLITKTGKESAQNLTEDVGTQLANAVSDEKENVGKKLGGLYSAAAENKFDVQDLHGKLVDAIEEAQNTPGEDAKASARKLQSLYDDMFKGTPKTLEGEMSEFTPSKQIPATKSGLEKAQDMVAKLKADDAAKGIEGNYDILPSEDKQFLTIKRVAPKQSARTLPVAEEDGLGEDSAKALAAVARGQANDAALGKNAGYQVLPSEDANFNTVLRTEQAPSFKTIPNTPGTPAQIIPSQPGAVVNASPIQVRTGGVDPQAMDLANLRRLQGVLTEMGGVAQGATPLTNAKAAANARSIAKGLGNLVDSSSPEIGQTKDQYATLIQALKNLGLNDSHFETDPVTGIEKLTPTAESKFSSLVQRSARDGETANGSKAASTIDDVLQKLGQVNPEKAQQLGDQVKDAGSLYDLMQKTQGLNFANQSTWLKSGGAYAGNALGQATKWMGDQAGTITKEAANSFPGKVISAVTRPISTSALAQGAKAMVASGSPTAMKLAQEVSTAMQQTGTQRNATLFALMQQPGYRELMKQHIPGIGDDSQQ